MARSYGKIFAAIWQDPEWCALPEAAQRLYMVVLSQPKLSLAGVLDLRINRLVRCASDSTVEGIQTALDALLSSRHCLLDGVTEELLIRSFVKHDVATTRTNSNLFKGLWSAWRAVESPVLRAEILHVMPDELWEREGCAVPAEAVELREQIKESWRAEPLVPTGGFTDGPTSVSSRLYPADGSDHGSSVDNAGPSTGASFRRLTPMHHLRAAGDS